DRGARAAGDGDATLRAGVIDDRRARHRPVTVDPHPRVVAVLPAALGPGVTGALALPVARGPGPLAVHPDIVATHPDQAGAHADRLDLRRRRLRVHRGRAFDTDRALP